jgi:hypothetical protein
MLRLPYLDYRSFGSKTMKFEEVEVLTWLNLLVDDCHYGNITKLKKIKK